MYIEKELVAVAKRENNRKRNYLVVNPLQGKHIPVRPNEAIKLFDTLAGIVGGAYGGERLLVIGFAETATAIGAEVAIRLGERYIQTTREEILQAEYICFTEAHSHAVQQKLMKEAVDRAIGEVGRIVFIEDEVTTGNTILSIVGELEEKYGRDIRFAVASILNGMTEEHRKVFKERGIQCHYILKTCHEDYGGIAGRYTENGSYEACDTGCRYEVDEVRFTGWMDTRRLVDSGMYRKSCEKLWKDMESVFHFEKGERILVVGTEEFMYPALYAARCMEQKGRSLGAGCGAMRPRGVRLRFQWTRAILCGQDMSSEVCMIRRGSRTSTISAVMTGFLLLRTPRGRGVRKRRGMAEAPGM